jgi:hypothetical protein
MNARPLEDKAWRGVTDANRMAAIAAAKHNATTQALDAVKSVYLADSKTVGDALAAPAVGSRVQQWLDARPITQIEFGDDRTVRVTLAAPAEDAFETLRSALVDQHNVAAPTSEKDWLSVKQDFIKKFPVPAGVAAAEHSVGPTTIAAPPVELPRNPPDWVNQTLDAESASAAKSNQLLAARAAEADASKKLADKVDALLLNVKTLGDLAKTDPRLRKSLDDTVTRLRKSKIDYRPDGGAKVKMTLDLHTFWDQLRASS